MKAKQKAIKGFIKVKKCCFCGKENPIPLESMIGIISDCCGCRIDEVNTPCLSKKNTKEARLSSHN